MFLSDLSIKRPVLATVMILALVVLGLFSYRRLSIDAFPDIDFPFLVIQTQYPGASPESVEREVSKPIEEAVNTVQGIKQVQSTSTEGFSMILVQFNLGTKVMDAQADVRAKIDALRQNLPADMDPPVVSRFDPSSQPIMSLSVRGDGWNLRALTQLADETVGRRLETISGVGNVTVIGGLKREIHVLLLPDRMAALGVSPGMVTAAVSRENADVPAGLVERGNGENLVRVQGRIKDPRDFGGIVVTTRGGVPIKLGQFARIEDSQEEARDAAYIDGVRAVGLEIRKVSGANTVDVADAVKAEMAQLNTTLPAGVHLGIIQDNSSWIRSSVDDVQKTLLEGAALTVLIVFLFLNSWRSTVITGLTLPVSVIAAFLAIYAFGFTLNTMSLLALTLAVGIVIDDAIVVLENIFRFIEEKGMEPIEAAKAGEHGKGFVVVAQEVRSLAEQSKQATAQIRGILNDIQKATSSAVLATEQGSKTVDEGVKQSAETGEAIRTLAQSISESAQGATQIAASSQQQLVGMEQVIAAMNNIKLATEQNVSGTKQTEGAAHNIHELGQKLKTLVAKYKV